MLSSVKTPDPRPATLELISNVTYELRVKIGADGCSEPVQIGSGKFAKVYLAMQRSEGKDIRPVAIKVLHDFADLQSERLFEREIDLLKELTTGPSVNVVRTLDVISLGPLLMCGCGTLYHPFCPRCGEAALRRRAQEAQDVFPMLQCPRCKYEISAEHITKAGVLAELRRAPAKRCCTAGVNAERAMLVNFADRKAVIMEQLDALLEYFVDYRESAIAQLLAQAPARPLDFLDRGRAGKVCLLEKVFLMVQLAEALAWLHGERRIVHKDLAPDNIMLRFVGNQASDSGEPERWRGPPESRRQVLNNLASYPTFGAKLIDFGLADQQELSPSWYDEAQGDMPASKLPYLSPEASPRVLPLPTPQGREIQFDAGRRRFRVPRGLQIQPGDILADKHDREHRHDLKISEVQFDEGGRYALFEGEPPVERENCQFQLIRSLSEAHDLYGLGAVFFFLLTGNNDEVNALKRLVAELQEEKVRLRWYNLLFRKSYKYRMRAIHPAFWQHRLLRVILRSMVRGQPESFAPDRTVRGPQPAQQLLQETKRIYHGLQQQILAEPLWRTIQVLGVVVVLLAALLLHRWLPIGSADRSAPAPPATSAEPQR